MPNEIAVLEQLAPADSKPCLFLKKRHANTLLSIGHLAWVIPGQLARKTPLYRRLTPDGEVMASKPFALRGLSAAIGPELAKAVRRREAWALAMFALMRKKREAAACRHT